MKSFLEKLPFYNQAVLPYHYAQSLVAGVRYGFPGKHLRVIGVTGTNGKTTTAFMIWRMLSHAGFKTGLSGALEQFFDEFIHIHAAHPP